MRVLPTLTVAILPAAILATAGSACAQVTVDLHALQALPERPAAAQPARPHYQSAPQATTTTPPVINRVAPLAQPPAGPAPSAPVASAPATAPATASTPAAPPPGASSRAARSPAAPPAAAPPAVAATPAPQPAVPGAVPQTA